MGWKDTGGCSCVRCSEVRQRLTELGRLIHEDGVKTFSAKARSGGLAAMSKGALDLALAEQRERLAGAVSEQTQLRGRLTRNEFKDEEKHLGVRDD